MFTSAECTHCVSQQEDTPPYTATDSPSHSQQVRQTVLGVQPRVPIKHPHKRWERRDKQVWPKFQGGLAFLEKC